MTGLLRRTSEHAGQEQMHVGAKEKEGEGGDRGGGDRQASSLMTGQQELGIKSQSRTSKLCDISLYF